MLRVVERLQSLERLKVLSLLASVGRQTLNVKKVDEGGGPFLAFLSMWKDLLMCPLQSILLQEGGEEHTICTKLRFLKLLLYYLHTLQKSEICA